MWISLGDKFDLEKHNSKQHPRKIQTNRIALVILVICFLANSYTVNHMITKYTNSAHIALIIQYTICAISIGYVLLLLAMKYLKNHKEIDMALLCFLIVLVFICCII